MDYAIFILIGPSGRLYNLYITATASIIFYTSRTWEHIIKHMNAYQEDPKRQYFTRINLGFQ